MTDQHDLAGASPAPGAAPGQGSSHLLRSIVQEAIESRATGIHVETRRSAVRVRNRIDGVLHEGMSLPPPIGSALVRAVKLWAELNVDRRDLPQEAWVTTHDTDGKAMGLRVHVMPHMAGEDVVIGIVDPSWREAWTLEKIGLAGREGVEELLHSSHGMVLFTGAAGSGKSTVMYSALNSLDSERLNITLVDTELNFRIPGVNLVPGASDAQMRVLLARHDLDVLALPEIDSGAAAAFALDAAGNRLALAVLHANDSVHALERLIRWGIPPLALKGSLAGIISSRLARRICTSCKAPYSPSDEALRALGIVPAAAGAPFLRGAGCDECRGIGFHGRMAFYELLHFDGAAARVLEQPPESFRLSLRERGFRTFQDDARDAVLAGSTTAEEAMRALGPGLAQANH